MKSVWYNNAVFLESFFGTNFLQDILASDWEGTLAESKSHPSLSLVSATANIASSWNSIWDEALELGVRGTKLMQGFFSALSRPTFGERLCPYCGDKNSIELL